MKRATSKRYAYDHCFGPKASQKVVYKHTTKLLIPGVINGYNATVFAYGATGAGKTITAIYAATQFMSQNEGFVLIVSVPYQDLADQWVQELKLFNINALKCYGSYSEWSPKTSDYLVIAIISTYH